MQKLDDIDLDALKPAWGDRDSAILSAPGSVTFGAGFNQAFKFSGWFVETGGRGFVRTGLLQDLRGALMVPMMLTSI